MLKIFAYKNNPVFPYDVKLTRWNFLTIHKVTDGFWAGYWEVTFDFNGNVKIDHFPTMTKDLWHLLWAHFRANL